MDLKQTSETIDTLIETIVDEVLNGDCGLSHEFNTRFLPKYIKNCDEAYKFEGFEEFFEELDKRVHHCLYWIEVVDNNQRNELMKRLDAYRETKPNNPEYRTVPAKALKSYNYADSPIIYLGVRRGKGEGSKQTHTNIARRINQHLGYYKTNGTQGLQLSSYATDVSIDVTIKVFEFKNLRDDYLNIIEKAIARKLQPNCGRH